jgi:SAM-dependent methyltransferase
VEHYDPDGYWSTLHASGDDLRVVGYPTLPLAFNRVLYKNTAIAVRRALRQADVDVTGQSVLDIGSGIGFWVDFWQSEEALSVAGADLVPGAVERLHARFPGHDFVVADLSERVPFPSREFGVVSAMGVLLHITDPVRFKRAVANIAKQVASDGVLVLVEPLVVHGRWMERGTEGAHNVVRTVADWEQALAGTGLHIAHLEPITFILSDPVDARSRLGFTGNVLWWRAFARTLRGREGLARVVMPPLGFVDRALVRLSQTGPSAKCIVLRR